MDTHWVYVTSAGRELGGDGLGRRGIKLQGDGDQSTSSGAEMWLRMEHSVALYAILACLVSDITSTSVSVCITNCGQCKQMFGNYFHGQACAEFCLSTNGFYSPDCNNPISVRNFLKRLH